MRLKMYNTMPGDQKALYETEVTGICLKKMYPFHLLLRRLGRPGLLQNLYCLVQMLASTNVLISTMTVLSSGAPSHASDLIWLAVSTTWGFDGCFRGGVH